MGMELNVEKIKKEMRRLELTYQRLADLAGISKQMAHYYIKSGSHKGAEPFAKAFDVQPKDLIKWQPRKEVMLYDLALKRATKMWLKNEQPPRETGG